MQIVVMFLFSILLILYGVAVLFRKEWIWKVREFSARLEGKGDIKRDENSNFTRATTIMGIAALILGLVSFVMNIAMFVITL